MCGCPFYIGFIGYLLSFYWICDVVDFEIHQHFMYIYMRKFCQLNWLTISEKVGLKLNIQKTKIMASGPITSWQIDGETVETVADFISLGSQITAGGDCSHEIKRRLLLGRKVMTNLGSILKSRDIVNKVPSSQGCGFSSGHVWMWDLDYKESWAQNWCFWSVVLKKTLRVPWTARRSSQSILKEISPGCLLEGLMLKQKLHYFGHLMWRADSFEETLMLGKTDGRRRRGRQDEMIGWHHRLNRHEFG